MSKKLLFLSGIVLFLFLSPVHGNSQTRDDTASDKVERTHRKHVVKQAVADTKNTASKDYHAAATATKKAWSGTKRGVSKGYHAADTAVRKAWRGTKKAVSKGYNSTVHPSSNSTDKSKDSDQDNKKQNDGTK